MSDISKNNCHCNYDQKVVEILFQIRSIAAISHNILSGSDASLYTEDVVNSLVVIKNLASNVENIEHN